jgi:hypothetical protein
VSKSIVRAVITQADMRAAVEAAASHETHLAHVAPVVDIHTRERVA